MARNLAKLKTNVEDNTLRLEKAAGNVSNDLDKVIHERMRLGIISALAANDKLSFNDLKRLLDTTDGNPYLSWTVAPARPTGSRMPCAATGERDPHRSQAAALKILSRPEGTPIKQLL